MATKKNATPTQAPSLSPGTLFIIRVAPGRWAGSPLTEVVTNRELATSFRDESEALRLVKTLPVGQVEAFRSRVRVGGPTVDVRLEPAGAKAVKGTVARAPRGISREEADQLLGQTKLQFRDMSKPQWSGPDPKQPRIVLNGGERVTKAWLYKMPSFSDLPGWLPEDRRPGAVSHEATVDSLETLHRLVTAVCEVVGVKPPKMPKANRSRKVTPAGGAKVTRQGEPESLHEAGTGQALESPTPDAGPATGTETNA